MKSTLRRSVMNADSHSTVQANSAQSTWLEAVPHLDPRHGGLSSVVPELSKHLVSRQGLQIEIANFAATEKNYADADQLNGLRYSHWPSSRFIWQTNDSLSSSYKGAIANADGVHIHGLWESSTSTTAKIARVSKKPYIISAHGMLEPWALANKGLKKRIYSALIERKNLQNATCLHALTSAEAGDYRRFGCENPIAIIPNGIELPRVVKSSLFQQKFPELSGKRIILFLGRIHPKKGVDILIDSWSNVARSFPDATLVIAGPDAENTRSLLEQRIQNDFLESQVCFTGMLDKELKWSALAAAECFVLPSYSEGFSVAVLEALGLGVPVIITEQCHVPEVEQVGAGWQIPPNSKMLAAALTEMLSNAPSKNAEIGQHGRKLVRERFTWDVVSSQMSALYHWVQGGRFPTSFPLLGATA